MAVRTKRAARVERNGPQAPQAQTVTTPPLNFQTIEAEIIGDVPFICDALSDRVKATLPGAILPPDVGKPDVTEEQRFQESVYLMPGSSWNDKPPRVGHKAVAFKKAMEEAAKDSQYTSGEEAKRAITKIIPDDGDLIDLQYAEMRRFTEPGRNPRGTPAPRYRTMLIGWKCRVRIRFNASVLSLQQIVNLLRLAGEVIGVGGYRLKGKKSSGQYGGWRVGNVKRLE